MEYSFLEYGERRLCLGHQQRDSQELEGDVAEEGKGICWQNLQSCQILSYLIALWQSCGDTGRERRQEQGGDC